MTIDFEIRSLQRYCTQCPQCSEFRRKQGTKSLSVFRDGDGFIRVKCHHNSECPYGVMKSFKDPDPNVVFEDTRITADDILSPIEMEIALPDSWQGGHVYWYKDVLGRPLFGLIRYPSKAFAPLVLLKTGEWKGGAGTTYPPGQTLFGAELLAGRSKVLVVEGEKAATAGQEMYKDTDIAVVSWRGGTNNFSNGAWGLLKGKKEIILWPDNDAPGIKAMAEIAKLLPDSNVKVLDVSHLPKGADIADSLSKEDIKKAFDNATITTSTAKAPMSWDQIKSQNAFLNQYKLSGFPVIDASVKLPPSGVIVIEGRTGHGKSAFAVNLADNFLRAGHRVVILSYEMPASRIFSRFVRVSNPDVGIEDALKDDHIPPYLSKALEIGQLEIYDQSAQFKAGDLIELLDSPDYNGALIVIDYLQIVPMSGPRYEKHEAIKEQLMDPLRVIANNHGFLVAALSQLTPNYVSPELDSPRECRDIHMSAEMVLRVWNRSCFAVHPIYDFIKNNYAVHVVKNRDGESNAVFDCDMSKGASITPKALVTPKAVMMMIKSARANRAKIKTGGDSNGAF